MSEPESVSKTSNVDRLLCLVAAGGGLGYLPRAPGTYGSLLGPLLVGLAQWGGIAGLRDLALLGVIWFLLGTGLSSRAIRVSGIHDPQFVVCDEFFAFAWVYLWIPVTWPTAIAGFALFRLFDIWKPGPVGWAERLPGGWGVMADDAVAGLLAGGCLWGLVQWLPELL
jgi:phosphatidylglycerophosphatase A